MCIPFYELYRYTGDACVMMGVAIFFNGGDARLVSWRLTTGCMR